MTRRLLLLLAGVVAAAVGALNLLAPVAFREAYGISLADDPSLLSETRSAGGAVLAVGLLLLTGAAIPRLTFAAAVSGTVLYLSYAASRLLSLLLDGVPDGGLVLAAAVELALGAACLPSTRPRAAGSAGHAASE